VDLHQQSQSSTRKLICSDLASRLNVKSGKKLLSKTSKPSSSAISSPPKAAIAVSSAKKDEVHRRRNPLNDMLRRRSGEGATASASDTPSAIQNVEPGTASQSSGEAAGVDVRMADRVAELERALVIAREEQNVLKKELEKAREHLHEEQNTVQQHHQTHQDASHAPTFALTERIRDTQDHDELSGVEDNLRPLDTPKDHHSRDQSTEDILQQNHDLRYKLARLQDQLASQEITFRNNLERALSNRDGEWNELRSRLHVTEKESQERLQQLLSLKSSISSLTRSDSQTTDSELADSFTQLSNRIREWVISNFRRSKLDAGDLPVETVNALRSLTPTYELIEKTDRLALYQGLVSSALMQVFEEPLVVGLPLAGPLATIRLFAEGIQDKGSEYREWRRATIRAIEKSKVCRSLEQGKSDFLHTIAGEIAHLLFTLTSVNLTSAAQSALEAILNATADLQRTLALQKARYQVLFFHHAKSNEDSGFDDRRMESDQDLDSMDEHDGLPERQFLFCVFPCLEKFGNEWGEDEDMGNVLLKARVCCGVG
jgi:hypothetical protein